MKKLVLSAAIAALLATPAVARVVSIEFKNDKGEAQLWKFDDATNTATAPNGETGPYTYDEAARKICGKNAEEKEVCVTFSEAAEQKVGASSPYTSTDGNKGVATITAIAE